MTVGRLTVATMDAVGPDGFQIIRPLSDDERADLLRELNENGPARGLSASEHVECSRLGVLRYAAAVAAELAAAETEAGEELRGALEDYTVPGQAWRQYARGVVDAIRWAIGEAHRGPLTGRHPDAPPPDRPEGSAPLYRELDTEETAALDVLEWRDGQGLREEPRRLHLPWPDLPHLRDYAAGVHAAILWLLCDTTTPPVTLSPAEQARADTDAGGEPR